MVNPYFVHKSSFCYFISVVNKRRFALNGWLWAVLWLSLGLGLTVGQIQPPTTPARRGAAARPNATERSPARRQQVTIDSARADARRRVQARADSVKQAVQNRADSLRALRSANRRPTVNWPDRRATRFSERASKSPFILRDPKGVSTDFRLDPDGRIGVTERVRSGVSLSGAPLPNNAPGRTDGATSGTATPGVSAAPGDPSGMPSPGLSGLALPPSQFGLPYRPAETIPFSTFNQLQNQRVEQSLWREYGARRDGQSAVSGRGLIPKLELPPIVDRLFGGSQVDFKPNGFVTLDFGYLYQFIDNPVLPVRQRRNGNFLFNEQISINFNGKIGERLGVLANFDTKASFNFENAIKVNYRPAGGLPGLGTGGGLPNLPAGPNLPGVPGVNGQTPGLPGFTPQNESILQGLEVGNISWAVNSQLIPGVQNLFGVKTQLRFGKLNATVVASQQRSRKQEIVLRGGTSNRPFEIRADQYDENRHFFLSQFFRNNYESSLRTLPQVTSGVNVTRVEVYVTNRTNTTETLRNIAGFQDLGEANPYNQTNPNVQPFSRSQRAPANNVANGLYRRLTTTEPLRQVDRTTEVLATTFALTKGTDYDLLRGAKRLTEREFKLQPELGYISLVTPLRNDEVLAVSYEYTYQGQRYKVGELTEDYQARRDEEVLVLKLLKSSTLRNNLQLPMWNLMMKNIYSLNTTQITRQGFQLRIIYKDDVTGIDNPNLQEGRLIQNRPLVQVFGMDRLNQQLDAQPDGNFDYVENYTVDSRYGKIIFPVLEPFGGYLERQFGADEENLRSKYAFPQLYRTTLADAQQLAERNKFFLRGSFQAGNGVEVQLPYGVNEQSVSVTAGGVPLTPGQDFLLESQTGRLRIINESVTNSGRNITISYEQPDLFQNQIRSLVGTRLDYAISPDISLGLTAMHMKETPAGFLSRVAIGNEPVNNTILGVNATIRRDLPGLTRLLDRLPIVQTKEMSTLQASGEVAQLFPGTNPKAKNDSYLDDFEAARTIFDLTRQPTRWRLGATPQQFPQGSFQNPLETAFNRAQLSVYSIDPSLYADGAQGVTSNIDTDDINRFAYDRPFLPQDLFPGRSPRPVQLPEAILDVSYFPRERGMYNYNPNLTPAGELPNPRQNFGSVTRAIASDNDFDNANIENITFWLLDPFVTGDQGIVRGNPDDTKNTNNRTGGKLFFNLGDISEDVIKDGRYTFENGFPIDGTSDRRVGSTDTTAWGRAPTQQFVTNAFQSGARDQQDIGLDGLGNRTPETEQQRFSAYLNQIRTRVTDPAARAAIEADPSNDDFRFYLGDEADQQKYVVARYKRFMGMENNSPENTSSNQFLTPASSTLPDIEDLNIDNTINDNEAYYEYEIDLRPGQLEVGRGYVIDKVVVQPPGLAQPVTWYQFRIPVREPLRKVGSINGFKSIRFMRMYLTDFEQPVVLRFAQLQMEANQYRKYAGDLNQRGLQEVPEPYDAQFTVSTVNIEENSSQQASTVGGPKYVYTVPPGYQRDQDFTTTTPVELNEQSMRMSVTNLRDGDSRGAFRNTNIDLLFRKQLKMFIHTHNPDDASGQVSAFVRLGTDYTENYYEIEIPKLVATPAGETDPARVWPAQNELNLALEELINLKAERNRNNGRQYSLPFTRPSVAGNGQYQLTVVGNPDLSSVQSIMIGMRNPRQAGDGERAQTFTIWVDELRSNGYDQHAGMGAIGALNLKLADLATVTASGRLTTFGFGGVQTRIGERERETTSEFGVSSAISVDKFLPANWGLRIPLYVNYDHRNVDPRFNPLDPDTPLDVSLSTIDNLTERDRYRQLVQDNTTRRGYNLSNVRKVKVNPNAKAHFWDVENLAFTYAYNDTKRTNILTDEYLQEQYRGGLSYTYSSQPKAFEPFRNRASFDAPYLRWLKDFNLTLLPSLVSIRADVDRSFIKTQLRSSDLTTNGIVPQFEKYFLFNRYYDLTWNLTRNLVLTYKAQANAIIDEPAGDINTQAKRDSILSSIKRLGRMKNYVQDIRATYRLPLDKIPFLDWIAADAIYAVGYQFQANSFGIADTLGVPFGNILRNNRERGITGRVDLIRLYNKLRYLRFVNTPAPVRKNFARNPGDIEDIVRGESRLLKNFTRALLTVRGINFSYTVQESTILPGFLPTPRFFGLSEENAPGLGFVLGSQARDIAYRAAERGWLTPSTVLNTPFQQTLSRNFNARTTLEPFRDFRMQVEWRLTRTDAYQEYYRPGAQGGPFETLSPVRNGQFSMSFWSFRTAFTPLRGDDTSPIFDRFEEYRKYFTEKLTAANPDPTKGTYTQTSQDVLIPAFFAAYSGQPKEKAQLSPFYNFPLPNWRVDYNGLSGLDFIKKRFSAFTITHSYTSNYSVGNFISNLDYTAAYVNLAVQGYPMATAVNQLGQFVPVFAMSTITMSEKFAPMLGVQFQTKNRISGRLEYNQSRDIALSLSNAQVAELTNKDLTGSVGFTRQNVRIPFRINGAYKKLKNDLTVAINLTLRDTRAIQRKLDAEQILTAGNYNFQFRPQVSYIVNRRLNVNVYFDRTLNDPLVSNSFRRATTAGGVQVKFNLAE